MCIDRNPQVLVQIEKIEELHKRTGVRDHRKRVVIPSGM